MNKLNKLRVLALLLAPVGAIAATIDVGQFLLLDSFGLQQFAITNLTGSALCTPGVYQVCDPVNITQWTLTVDYIDYAATGQQHSTSQWLSAGDDIGPTSGGYTGPGTGWVFGPLPDLLNPPPTSGVIILQAVFSGRLSQSPVNKSDPDPNDPNTILVSSFYPLPFITTLDLSNDPIYPSLAIFGSQELIVNDNPPSTFIPDSPNPRVTMAR